MPLLLLLLVLPMLLLALMPLVLWQRYRVGTARRLARPWLAAVNLVAMGMSAVFFLITAAVTNLWIPNAFWGAAAGLGIGMVLGVLGLNLTRWEAGPRSLHYTPNRWLILTITLLVSGRLLYGLWRSFAVARAGVSDTSVVTAFGVPESLAAGAIVLGYYFAYGAGLQWRIRSWQRRALRGM